mgnify:FL=1
MMKEKDYNKNYSRKYYLENREKIKQYQNERYQKNKTTKPNNVTTKEYARQYYIKNRERCLKRSKKYQVDNKAKIKEYQRTYVRKGQSAKSLCPEYASEYYIKNRERIIERIKVYQDKNRMKIREYNRWYYHSTKKNYATPHKKHSMTITKVRGPVTLNLC